MTAPDHAAAKEWLENERELRAARDRRIRADAEEEARWEKLARAALRAGGDA